MKLAKSGNLESLSNYYADYLVQHISYPILEGYTSVYNKAIEQYETIKNTNSKESTENMGCDINIIYQCYLENMSFLGEEHTKGEYNRIANKVNNTNPGFLDQILKAVFRSYIEFLTCSFKNNSSILENKYYEKIDKYKFIHECYLESNKFLYSEPNLFWPHRRPLEYGKNRNKILKRIVNGIKNAIKSTIPMEIIIEEYLASPTCANSDTSTDMYMSMNRFGDSNHGILESTTSNNLAKLEKYKMTTPPSLYNNVNMEDVGYKSTTTNAPMAPVITEPSSSKQENSQPVNPDTDGEPLPKNNDKELGKEIENKERKRDPKKERQYESETPNIKSERDKINTDTEQANKMDTEMMNEISDINDVDKINNKNSRDININKDNNRRSRSNKRYSESSSERSTRNKKNKEDDTTSTTIQNFMSDNKNQTKTENSPDINFTNFGSETNRKNKISHNKFNQLF